MSEQPPHQPASQVEQLVTALVGPFAPIASAIRTALASVGKWMGEHEEEVRKFLVLIAAAQNNFGMPDNWRELPASLAIRLLEIARSEGLCVVWVPREEILRELLGAGSRDARGKLLVQRRNDILDDCERVLRAQPVDAITDEWALTRQYAICSISAARAGHDAAAQALAGALIGAVLSELFGVDRLGAVYKRLKAPPTEVELLQVRSALLASATTRVLTDTEAALPGFNRHATAHGHLAQFGEVEMLEAVMLLTAWLREWEFQATFETITSGLSGRSQSDTG